MGGKEKTNVNMALLSGTLENNFVFDHEVSGRKFYKTRIKAMRKSGTYDFVPIMISNELMNSVEKIPYVNVYVKIRGEIRSNNKRDYLGINHLELFLFVKEIEFYDKNEVNFEDVNDIDLEGYICKKPIYRKTPKGKEITELCLAVNRNYNSAYIPCIVWGTTAEHAKNLQPGQKVILNGRIQSRQYFKKYSSDSEDGEIREAYEVSASKLKWIFD